MLPFWISFEFPDFEPHQGQKGIKNFTLNPGLIMVSHISGFKVMKGPDFLSSTPQHHLPPRLCQVMLSDKVLHLLFWSGSSFIVKVGGSRLYWAGQGPFPALLLSHQDLVLSVGLGKRVPHGPGLQQTWYEQAAAQQSSVLPWHDLCGF